MDFHFQEDEGGVFLLSFPLNTRENSRHYIEKINMPRNGSDILPLGLAAPGKEDVVTPGAVDPAPADHQSSLSLCRHRFREHIAVSGFRSGRLCSIVVVFISAVWLQLIGECHNSFFIIIDRYFDIFIIDIIHKSSPLRACDGL